MRLSTNPLFPQDAVSAYDRRLQQRLVELFAAVAAKVNGIAFGASSALDGGGTTAPVAGTWAQGDTWRNTSPVELGAAGAKYVIRGWICTAGGSPGTWVQDRALTGG